MQTYNLNYSNENLVIPGEIWNNSKINGLQKPLLALIKKFSKNGTETVEALTRMQAQILATPEKDIKYNLNQLHKKGFINVYKDDNSKTKFSIKYTYMPETAQKTSETSSSLF